MGRVAKVLGLLLLAALGISCTNSLLATVKEAVITGSVPAPANLTADPIASDRVLIQWSDNSTQETGFAIERSMASGSGFAQVATVAAGSVAYTDLGREPLTTYFYRVRAQVTEGFSDYSNVTSAKTLAVGVPTGVAATDGTATDKVVVSWDALTGPEKFYVYRDTAWNGPYSLKLGETPNGTTYSYDDATASPGILYFYKVTAWTTASGETSLSFHNDGYRRLQAPPGITAADGGSTASVGVSWSAVTGADSYSVERATAAVGPYSEIGTVNNPTVTYTDSGATPGIKYYYRVRAYANSSVAYGSYGTENDGYRALSAPTGVGATDGTSSTQVTVSWSAVTGNDTYYVERGTVSGGPYSPLTSTAALTIDDTSVAAGVQYYYRVRVYASSSASYSTWSTEDGGYRKLGTPGSVAASDGSSTAHVTVSWGSIADATAYYVERATVSGGPYTDIGNTTSLSMNDTGATPGLKSYYRVRAYASTSGSYSDYSGETDGYRKLSPPASPTGSTNQLGWVALSWTAATGATRYDIYRATVSGGPYTSLASVAAPSVAYNDWTGIAEDVIYYYVVRSYASTSNSQSDNSTQASGYTTALVLQAENATLGGTATVQTIYGNYHGTGYVRCDTSGATITWSNVWVPSTSSYTLRFRHSRDAAGDASTNWQYKVGAGAYQPITFVATGDWTAYVTTASFVASLVAGNNTIVLQKSNTEYVSIDELIRD